MKANEIMTAHEVWACSETTTVRETATMMAQHDVGSIPILDGEGRLEGIVTDRDLCVKVLGGGLPPDTPVREVMTRSVRTVPADASLEDVESVMREYRIRRVPVVNESNRLLGFIALADLARHCHKRSERRELVEVLEAVSAP